MSNSMIPAPEGAERKKTCDDQSPGGDRDAGGSQQSRQGEPEKPPIPSREDCLQAMAQLPGLVALGVLKPAQANSIRASYREILQYHEKTQSQRGQDGLSTSDVLELARKDPHIFSLLEPILSDRQIRAAMKDAKNS